MIDKKQKKNIEEAYWQLKETNELLTDPFELIIQSIEPENEDLKKSLANHEVITIKKFASNLNTEEAKLIERVLQSAEKYKQQMLKQIFKVIE